MAYKIDIDAIEKYVEYLKKFKKKLESELDDFDKSLKKAHVHWDDENYEAALKAKEEIYAEQKKLISCIEISLKKLKQMHEEYSKYLRRK
jgi:hypothetical protein